MNRTEIDFDYALEVREEAGDGIAATIYGRAVPYDTPTKIGGVEERFAVNAIDPADVVGKPLAWRHDEPIGVITEAANENDGLYITADLLDTAQGRDAALLARRGAVRGLSIGFQPLQSKWNRAKTAVTHLSAKVLETSLTHMPAYATAGVSAIREENNMSEVIEAEVRETPAIDVEAREAIADVRKQLDAVAHVSEPVHPLVQYRSLGDYVKAVYQGAEDRALDVSNLADAAGLVPPIWLTEIMGVLDRGRPCISAIGGPRGAAGSGLTIEYPYFDGDLSAIVAVQAAQNDEVNSVDIDIKKGTVNLATYAAGNRLTIQVIERTDPSYVTAHMRIMMGAYGTETDYAFQNGLWANDTAGLDYDFSADTDGSKFIEAVWAAAVDVETATGQPAEVVYVNSAVYKKLGAWSSFQSQNYPVDNVGGVFDGRTGRATVMGLPLVLAREFATNETEDAIVTNRMACGWFEDGPRTIQTDIAANLGRETAIYGYGGFGAFIPAGIVSIYNQP